LDHFGSLASIEDAFVNLVAKLPYYGMAVVCAEDPGVVRCLSRLTKPVQTYGWSKECDYYAQDVAFEGVGSRFQVFGRSSLELPHEKLGELRLNVPGRHNVLNALAVTAIATALDVPFKKIAQGFEAFSGVKRRFEVRWREARTSRAIVDDYGHHPTEIKATLEAARTFWKGKITVVFQPHRYSRTLHCHDGFLNAFHAADRVLLTDIYAAGEDPVQGVTSEALAKDIAQVLEHRQVQYVGELAQAKEVVLSHFEPGELVLCFGAGSITRLPEMLIQGLS
jgi:UDP-N-acetylmuramate--alanine ligase